MISQAESLGVIVRAVGANCPGMESDAWYFDFGVAPVYSERPTDSQKQYSTLCVGVILLDSLLSER